ncbi:MAG: hypothetical protein MN733_35795 [Nitrososphaera sp.]|nr:hypothetical protein [Nitrososphaera sp.]
MPIPFNDLADDSDLGLAGFLRFQEESDGKGIRAALFIITSRGAPIEFSFTRIGIAPSFLWREGDAARHAVTTLSKAMFEASSKKPSLILALAEEVAPQVFTEDLEVRVPICRVSSLSTTVHATAEIPEILTDTINLFWVGDRPAADSQCRQLLEALRVRKLLTEPFDRAAVGLQEAFNSP